MRVRNHRYRRASAGSLNLRQASAYLVFWRPRLRFALAVQALQRDRPSCQVGRSEPIRTACGPARRLIRHGRQRPRGPPWLAALLRLWL